MLRKIASGIGILLAFVLFSVPMVAHADGTGVPEKLTVAGAAISDAGYWVTSQGGALAAGDASNYNVHYDGAGTLTLCDATIGDDGILVEADQNGTNDGDLSLTIVLEGKSSVEGNVWLGMNDGGTVGGAGYRQENASTSLTIAGSGSLDVTGSLLVHGVQTTDASGSTLLTVRGGARVSVVCVGQYAYPVVINGSHDISVTVDGAALTTQSVGNGDIYSNEPAESPKLVGLNGAVVRTGRLISGGGGSFDTSFENSVLFQEDEGEVFGTVTLSDDFSVLDGETLTVDPYDTLTIPGGVTLTVEQGATLVNHGTVNVEGAVVNRGTIVCDSHSGGASVSCDQATCALCGAKYGAVGPHRWGEPAWDWSADGERLVATFTCENNASHVETRETVPTATVKVAPTCTEPGVMLYTGTVEFEGTEYTATSEAAIPATGHDFVDGVCENCGAKQPAGTSEPAGAEHAAIPATGDPGLSSAVALVTLGVAALGVRLALDRSE